MAMALPFTIAVIIATAYNSRFVDAFSPPLHQHHYHATTARRRLATFLHSASMQPITELADDDLIALPFDGYLSSTTSDEEEDEANKLQLRLCVIRNQQYIYPLIRHEDDVETDLFLDPRCMDSEISLQDIMQWWSGIASSSNSKKEEEEVINEVQYYGVGWYGQRPVPSLGGGPGYGAEADEIWSIDEDVLEQILSEEDDDGVVVVVDLPVIDVGMAHGEKARGGALF